MGRETNLKDQLELYQTQVKDMESNLGGTTSTFQNFRKEMERLTKQLRKVERDTEEWQNKFQESQVYIIFTEEIMLIKHGCIFSYKEWF